MISKKKVTALALAGLFVTPVLADTYVPDNSNSIQSGDGYLTADDDLFSKALKNSRNRTDSSKDAVKLSMWGKHIENNKDGHTELKLSSGKTYATSASSCSPTTPCKTIPFIAQASVLIKKRI